MTTSNPTNKTVVVMRAPSGYGKSTYVKTHFPSAVVCSADDFFVSHGGGTYKFNPRLLGVAHKVCLEKFSKALSEGADLVVVDNTNIRRDWYKDYVRLATEAGYKVFQKVLTTRYTNTHGVPEDKVGQMLADFQTDDTLPHWQEG